MDKEDLFKRYVELSSELLEIDEKLSKQCRSEIQCFLDRKEFDKAKKHVSEFYKTSVLECGYFESIEKDLIYHSINLLIKEEKNKNNF